MTIKINKRGEFNIVLKDGSLEPLICLLKIHKLCGDYCCYCKRENKIIKVCDVIIKDVIIDERVN